MQSLWLFAHFSAILHQLWPAFCACEPHQTLRLYQEHLMFLRYHLWPSVQSNISLSLHICTSEDVDLVVLKDCRQRVQDLLDAERINLMWGQQVYLLDGGCLVPPDAYLHMTGFYGPYLLTMSDNGLMHTSQALLVICCLRLAGATWHPGE